MFNLKNEMKLLAVPASFGKGLDTKSYVYLRN